MKKTVLKYSQTRTNRVAENKNIDTYEQLRRRINYIVYHYFDENGERRFIEVPMSEYTDYKTLCQDVKYAKTPDWVYQAEKCENLM